MKNLVWPLAQFFAFISLCSCQYSPLKDKTSETKTSYDPKLKFSTTQEWQEDLKPRNQLMLKILKSESILSLTPEPPPANDSEQTKNEILNLLELQSKRSLAQLNDIRIQKNKGLKLGRIYIISDLDLYRPNSRVQKFLEPIIHDSNLIIMSFKQKFDRVRPEFLEPKIKPAIRTPNHPSYPNAHAMQSYLMALLLSEIDPSQKDKFLVDAIQVGLNREIAGVHYHSDTTAGVKLAKAIFEAYKKTVGYSESLRLAKLEWEEQKYFYDPEKYQF